ncbi:MAG TPA: hypothetical protein VFC24_05475 [Casimicrobiaceae bacterium]|nr:hypothetical protein [Casimicrobiaceae bacterium]
MILRRSAAMLALASGALMSCVTAPDPHRPRIVQHVSLAAYALREECLPLVAHERLEYRFTASEPVRFALQYREANAVLVPLERDSTREDAGIYPVPETRDYCLVWEAGPGGAFLDYRFVALAPAAP